MTRDLLDIGVQSVLFTALEPPCHVTIVEFGKYYSKAAAVLQPSTITKVFASGIL